LRTNDGRNIVASFATCSDDLVGSTLLLEGQRADVF